MNRKNIKLWALILTAALVFGWQYHLDGLVLDHAIDTYAYVGTLVRTEGQVLDYEATRDERDFYGITGEMGGPAFLEQFFARALILCQVEKFHAGLFCVCVHAGCIVHKRVAAVKLKRFGVNYLLALLW